MEKTSKRDQVIACIIKGPGMPFIGTFMGLVGAISDYDIEKVPKKSVMFVDSEGLKKPHEQGALLMIPASTGMMELGIAHFESMKESKKSKTRVEGDPDLIVGFGSREFCQAFVHFMAIKQGGECRGWGLHLTRHLSKLNPGDVIWRDLSTSKFWQTTSTELYATLPNDSQNFNNLSGSEQAV